MARPEAMTVDATGSWLRTRSAAGIGLLLLVITALHYATPPRLTVWHDVYRRLYYLPVVLGAFAGGTRLSLLAATIATIAYIPHAFILEHRMDPGPPVDKVAEILLYFALAILAGVLVERERAAQRKAADEARERASAEASAARLEGLVHLTRGLAHEIRNPLGGIQGAIEIIAGEIDAKSPAWEMADIGLRETQRLERVVSDFLAFARPRPPVMQAFAGPEVVRHVAHLLGAEAETRGIRLAAEPEADLPQAFGDADQVTQVLVNLVRNALEATPTGGEVKLLARRADGQPAVLFEVSDTGPGVPAELGNAIYDPYVTGRKDGSGLGLSIAALLIRQQGALLSHASRGEQGTVFRFQLQAAPGRAP